jgi:Uma2 family endonuclease
MARKGKATYEDLLKLPDHVVGEILGGELIVSPRPAIPHAIASSAIGAELHGPFGRSSGRGGGPGGWWILDEPELHFGPDVVVPDLAGWRRERMPTPPDAPFIELPPDWVCEVVSPKTAKIDRTRKMALYAHVKIPHLWLVDPLARTLEVYRQQETSWYLVSTFLEDAKVRAEPFDAVELELSGWWIDSTASQSK